MPIYEYEHCKNGCSLGKVFELTQSITSEKLTACPYCGNEVKRLISLVAISTPTTNSELKDHGFTKLVRRDNGVYENVTATDKKSRYWDTNTPGSMPDIKSKIRE